MVRHPALREVIGADALVAHAGAHLAAPLGGELPGDLLLFRLVQPGGQDAHGFVPVLELAALLLALHHHTGGLVDEPHRRRGLVHVLASGSEARNTCISTSAGLSCTSTSSISGSTATVAVEVWTRPPDSVSGTRWTRWTPLSNFRRE